jgi:type II secretory ATPase GspE/PulE/Tfp pilus assembly ATPase PilB-like protein
MTMLQRLITRACPRCECESIRRSRRVGFMERCLLRMSFIRPYRCLDCDRRFYLYDGIIRLSSFRRSLHTSH